MTQLHASARSHALLAARHRLAPAPRTCRPAADVARSARTLLRLDQVRVADAR